MRVSEITGKKRFRVHVLGYSSNLKRKCEMMGKLVVGGKKNMEVEHSIF